MHTQLKSQQYVLVIAQLIDLSTQAEFYGNLLSSQFDEIAQQAAQLNGVRIIDSEKAESYTYVFDSKQNFYTFCSFVTQVITA
jgi:hypothetical protein